MITLLDTYNKFYIYDYQSYVDWCTINDEEPESESSNDYLNYVEESSSREYEEFFTDILHSKYNKECVITGSLGRWDGTHNICPEFKENLYSALCKIVLNGDDVTIEMDTECIYVTTYDHDGESHFEVRILSNKAEYGDDEMDFNDESNFINMPTYLF